MKIAAVASIASVLGSVCVDCWGQEALPSTQGARGQAWRRPEDPRHAQDSQEAQVGGARARTDGVDGPADAVQGPWQGGAHDRHNRTSGSFPEHNYRTARAGL